MIEYEGYIIADPDSLETPVMLVFEQQLDHNIRALCELVGGGSRLMVHVKTHKSAAVARRQLEAEIAGFKCATLKELEMVLAVGAPAAILAYPLAQRCKVERFTELTATHEGSMVYVTVSAPEHVQLLGEVAEQQQQRLRPMLDLDVGMHRTGIAVGPVALELYRTIAAHPFLEPAGLHAYDGHEHIADPQARQAATQMRIEAVPVQAAAGGGWSAGAAGRRWRLLSFAYFARTEGMYGSPGTTVYWDHGYSSAMPDMPFRWAALILTQVIDRHPDQETITTDLGYKAIAGDPPLGSRVRLLGKPDAELRLQNEEHGVFHWPGDLPRIGAYLLAVPGHVCPTTIRYPGSYLIDPLGEVVDFLPHTARDRQ